MKKENFLKIALTLTLCLPFHKICAQSVVITTIVDGTLADSPCTSDDNGSLPRFIELYVSGTIDFQGYDLDVELNGPNSSSGDWVSKNISDLGTITNQFVYLIKKTDTTSFEAVFPGKTKIGISLGTINGNDSFRVEDPNGNIIDIFGNPSEITDSSFFGTWSYKDSYAKRKNGKIANAGNFNEDDFFYAGENALDNADCNSLANAVNLGSYIAWTGATNNAWTNATNWNIETIPEASDDIVIPNGLTNYPTVFSGTSITANSITIESGGTLIAEGTSTVTGDITYNRNLPTADSWYLVSSPVDGETITDLISNHTFITSSNNVSIGIAPYDNSQTSKTSGWSYQTNNSTGDLENAKGYSIQLEEVGNLSFTGALRTDDTNASVALVQNATNGNNYNLIGNPYTSYINSSTFLNTQSSDLESTFYIWNGTSYDTKTTGTSPDFMIAPGQGFFVEAKTSNPVTFIESNQSHNSIDTFQKSDSKPEIKLNLTDGKNNRTAEIYYIAETSTGFDTGYDGKLFGGVSNSFAIYSQLISDNNGNNYAIQSLPNFDYENMIIPIGVNAAKGLEINFTAEILNLPPDLKVYLEDKENNTYTRLDGDNNHKISLTKDLSGIGRFYLHTSKKSILNVQDLALENVSIFQANRATLTIVGLYHGKINIKLYNLLGQQVLNNSFEGNGLNNIRLSNINSGIYLVHLTTQTDAINKKISIQY